MYQKILVACLLLLFISACNKGDQTVIVNIEDDFYIDMFENISNGEQRFQIDISTILDQSCTNYQIDFDISIDKQSNKIELIINDLVEPDDCLEGTAPARRTVPFGYLLTGAYAFSINLKDAIINTGRLTVFGDHYLLDMDSDDGIEMIHTRLNRIPQNTLWGYIAYNNGSSSTDAERFISDLEAISTFEDINDNSSYPSGYYGYFELDDTKTLSIETEIVSNHHIPFLLHGETNDLSELMALKENACQNNSDLDIHIFTEYGLELTCE